MAEAAGFVLAVLPLLISAAESYRQCIQPIERFLRFNSHVRRFQTDFNVQKTIFRNQCRILLKDVVENEVATRMLQDVAHPSWQDQGLDDELSNQLQDSKEALIAILYRIAAILEDLGDWSEALNTTLQREKRGEKTDLACTQKWVSAVKTKLKFSFDENKLEKKMCQLKKLNDDFRTLSSQTSRLQEHKIKCPSSRRTCNDIGKLRSVQQASCRVYEVLSKSCSKHTVHRTHFGLEVKRVHEKHESQIRFQVAFDRPALATAAPKDLVFIEIESIVCEIDEQEPVPRQNKPGEIKTSLKRAMGKDSNVASKKTKKSVAFACAVPNVGSPLKNYNLQHLQSLCKNRNFCDQLRACLQHVSGDCYLGTLDDMECYKHLVYFPKRRTAGRPALTLQEILSVTSQRSPSARLSQLERCHLASSLATSVLQYYSTPWLIMPLRSQEILFFGAEASLQTTGARAMDVLSEPHINVAVKDQVDSPVLQRSNFDLGSIAPNAILYHLAILLIELAFSSNFEELLTSEQRLERDFCIDFRAAKQLSALVSREMGPMYQRIVQKCLGCHFRAGFDLNDTTLQTEVYTDVVQELENLEEKFRTISLS